MNLTVEMVRRRVLAAEEADDARIAADRKKLREERAAEIQLPRPSLLSRLRVRRTLVIP